MCGLFGFSSSEKGDERHALLLQSLVIEDEIRGRHSTGLVVVDTETGQASIRKKAIIGSDFVAENLTNFLFTEKYNLAIGHNRQATRGIVNDRNAHPFGLKVGEYWDFACHNGTFSKDIVEFLEAEKFDVDSEVVLTKVAREIASGKTEPEAIRDVFKKISEGERGDYAVLYVAGDTLYAFRNTGRPLFIFETHNLGTWLCSTEEIFKRAYIRLHGILPPYNQEIKEKFQCKPYKIYAIKDGQVYHKGLILTDEERQALERKIREREQREGWWVQRSFQGRDGVSRGAISYSQSLFGGNVTQQPYRYRYFSGLDEDLYEDDEEYAPFRNTPLEKIKEEETKVEQKKETKKLKIDEKEVVDLVKLTERRKKEQASQKTKTKKKDSVVKKILKRR